MSANASNIAAQRWHRLQKAPGSCVAACRAIVNAWRGGEGEEQGGLPFARW
ncbi:hypothetical protein [Sorangium sp. So ce124]|uniref:hypothetical protein n=1 Tax=Sorangium sp. So ce124 TaxID=3133280 RepID=UPI003F608611